MKLFTSPSGWLAGMEHLHAFIISIITRIKSYTSQSGVCEILLNVFGEVLIECCSLLGSLYMYAVKAIVLISEREHYV